MRGDVGRHAHRDAAGAVDQQIGDAAGQNQRLFERAVVVLAEIDRFFVQVDQKLSGDLGHAHFGVAHRRRPVAVDGAEVALAVDQGVAHGETLRQAHDGVVNRRVPVGVVFADHVADDAGGFFVRLVPIVAHFAHGEQAAAMDGLQTVADVGQRPAYDHAHGVIEIGLFHFVRQIDGKRLLGELKIFCAHR